MPNLRRRIVCMIIYVEFHKSANGFCGRSDLPSYVEDNDKKNLICIPITNYSTFSYRNDYADQDGHVLLSDLEQKDIVD